MQMPPLLTVTILNSMYGNQNSQDGFKIGEAFEEYLEKRIFDSANYVLVEKTPSYIQNSKRYVESSKKPDFKFRCKKTNQEFYIEAKYRSRFNVDDKVSIIDLDQYKRYNEHNKKQSPVFIAVGVGGSPTNPGSISLIPLDQINYSALYKSVLNKYRISTKRSLNPDFLNEFIDKISPNVHDKSNPIRANSSKNGSTKNRLLQFLVITISIIAIAYFVPVVLSNNSKGSTLGETQKQKIQTQIQTYYYSLDNNNNNVEVLNNFISAKVDRWYDTTNVDIDYIKRRAISYYNKYPIHKTKIDWASFSAFLLPNGDYSIGYNLNYQIKKVNSPNPMTYMLHINSILDPNLKIKSMYEEKLSK
jgi:hypothetical protein